MRKPAELGRNFPFESRDTKAAQSLICRNRYLTSVARELKAPRPDAKIQGLAVVHERSPARLQMAHWAVTALADLVISRHP